MDKTIWFVFLLALSITCTANDIVEVAVCNESTQSSEFQAEDSSAECISIEELNDLGVSIEEFNKELNDLDPDLDFDSPIFEEESLDVSRQLEKSQEELEKSKEELEESKEKLEILKSIDEKS